MLISKVPDNDGGKGEGLEVPDEESDAHEYQTANELFELMAKNSNFDTTDVDKLTTRDLVLLYKNIDLGTKLMSSANELKHKKPNQYVETIVYNDEPESDGSDVSDIYSNEDLHNVFLVNKERIDLLNTPPSVENTLCHKLGDLDIQSSDVTTEYDRHFLFKDPYIKEQLKTFKLMNKSSEMEGTVLPASLLDYICCKRLEDNYNFYMDNIIRYVKHTIEQLKRISNGDYLTDKAKEKWREVENTTEDRCHINAKVLATSTSIPLHVERKIGGRKSTWDDIVHSAVDIRSLSKILEKKIVVEVPKLLCGSYKLLSKCCADNVIISCKKEKRVVEETINAESRVDVVFKLQRSETGQVMSNISSIMILQTAPVVCDTIAAEIRPLPLPFIERNSDKGSPERKVKIIEIEQINMEETIKEVADDYECSEVQPVEDPYLETIDYECSDNEGTGSVQNYQDQESSDSSDALREILDKKLMSPQREAACDVFADDLRLTIQKLTMQSALTEESGEDMSQSPGIKKKSPTRVRIKSPYENQSYIIEEKKRRKLLEIRERREKKKMALAENCKITKHKYGKGAIMPQSASSVTKLSISNKSFYNSIYGQSANVDPNKQTKGRSRKGGKRDVVDIGLDGLAGEHDTTIITTPERNSKKYINRSYYLDDAVTEMMYMNMKRNENDGNLCSTSTSVISNDFRNNLNLLSQLIGPSETEINIGDFEISPDNKIETLSLVGGEESNVDRSPEVLCTSQSTHDIVPANSPNVEEHDNDQKKAPSPLECRKSIDKIYTLMKKLGKSQDPENKSLKSKYLANNSEKVDTNEARTGSTCQGSDSGTSLKHHLTSSNPSSFSFDKNNNEKPSNSYNQKPGSPTAVVPKVIISAKSSSLTPKADSDKSKKDRRKSICSPTIKIPENPLKAISQLLHEFENVQKTRQKPNLEQKPKKMEIVSSDGKSGSRQSSFKRRSRLEQHNDSQTERYARVTPPKDKKPKQYTDLPKIPYQQIPVDDKHFDRIPKKKITDILDEAKEARGEAVRGPSKFNSRLNSLAQPKRTYVQAHSEEYQIKYGKNLMADRLQRLAAAPPPAAPDRNSGSANSRSKTKRSGTEAMSVVSVKLPPPPMPPLDRPVRIRHSTSSSPENKEKHGVGPSYKQIIVPETPQTLKKKMVAVESYVKNHYGRTTSTSTSVVTEPQSVQKSRVPLLPTDIELASTASSPTAEGSTELGSRLHHMVNTIIKSTSQGLEVLTECHESNSKISKDTSDDYSLAENLSRSEHVSSDSDYTIDVLDDKNVITSVAKVCKDSEMNQKQTNVGTTDATHYDIQSYRSVTELEKLENALCRRISVGTFQKRLRIKNLTLTPKPSMQQLFVLQSGDAGSLLVQTPISPDLKETKTEHFPDLTCLPVLSQSHLDWRFTNFPMQISTVGYSFPEYNSIHRGSSSLVQLFDVVSKPAGEEKPSLITKSTDKNNQCFRGAQPPLSLEQAAQVDVPAPTLVTVGISSTHFIESDKKEEIKQNNVTNTKVITEPKHVFIDYSENKTVENTLKSVQKPKDVLDEKKVSVSAAGKPDGIEYTTSLDILVGLLNEIQKITTCQTELTNNDNKHHDTPAPPTKELETIMNKAAAIENSINSPYDAVSFTSLDRLRQLESNQSLYSFYLSDNEESEQDSSKFNFPPEIIPLSNDLLCPKPVCADKEVGVDLVGREFVNRFTDIPSQVFPIGLNHSTNMTNSLIGVLREPSTQSMFSFAEYHSIYSNASSLSHKTIIDIPQIIITRESNQSLAFYELNNKAIEKPNENKSCNNNKNTMEKIQSFDKARVEKKRKIIKNKFRLKTDFDPIMKMKRDILVTVYSILVFTVFAALSFPEMLYRV